MGQEKNTLAVIQARGGSKGIPKKNIYNVANHPLIAYTIAAAHGSKYISNLVVSTDSEEIADVSRKYGAEVPYLRPDHLSGDKVLSVDSLIWSVQEYEQITGKKFDYIVELPCVSPLRNSKDIDGALHKLINTNADSVISLASTGEKHPIRLKKIIDDEIYDFTEEYPEPKAGSRRQDLKPESFIRNGAIYAMTRSCLLEKKSRHGESSKPFQMPAERSINIDEKLDLIIAESLIQSGYCDNHPRKLEGLRDLKIYKNSEKPKLLITANLDFLEEILEEAKNNFEVHYLPNASLKDLKEAIPNCDAWICNPTPNYVINKNLLNSTKIKAIATPSTGSNHLDIEYLHKKNIKFFCLKGRKVVEEIKASSEFTFLLGLELLKNSQLASEFVKKGHWRDIEDQVRGRELYNRNVGIIGLGRIGQNVARYSEAFGAKILGFDPYKKESKGSSIEIKSTAQEVISQSDLIFICVHLNEETKEMVDKNWFKQFKPGSYFINTSRGEIINEDALIWALDNNIIKRAAVDVVSGEATLLTNGNKLISYSRENPNKLLVTPHIAGLTSDSESLAAKAALDYIVDILKEG